MPDTLLNVVIPPNVWTDLYAASGITVGNRIAVQNIGVCDIFLSAQAIAPVDNINHQVLKRSQFMVNDAGDNGAWALCIAGGLVNVRLV